MRAQNDSLIGRLSRYREIKISVTGRKSGRAIAIPVWFVFESGKLYLLPVHGSDTQWYKNVLKDPSIMVDAQGSTAEVTVRPVRAGEQVSAIAEKFRNKYGSGDVKKYYSNFDAALIAEVH